MRKSDQSSLPYLRQKESHESTTSLSLYQGATAQPKEIQSAVVKLVAVFPEINSDFVAVLVERMIAHGFTHERVVDAVNNCIDTNPYKRPSIADIISFDKRIKLFTYNEMIARCTPTFTTDNFEKVTINGATRYYEK